VKDQTIPRNPGTFRNSPTPTINSRYITAAQVTAVFHNINQMINP
ncbi:unnamed protein product, partial [Allacma fusca]